MKSDANIRPLEEIELKLALPTPDPSSLAKRLAQTPALARRKATHQHLHNTYYDTPAHLLRQERAALRVRRMGRAAKPQRPQTIQTTPWSGIDPHGTMLQTLAPCFVTIFDRTSWLVHRRDGSVVEVALDIGQIVAGDKHAPICELALALKAGQPAALFNVAQQIARTIAVLPMTISKAERGYALAQDGLDMPLRAQPPKLATKLPLPEAAGRVLREMFCQFTTNLNTLRTSDDPEVVHQARVGWRRFRSAMRLFKPALAIDAVPSWQTLQPLLTCLSELRDFDVARTETLPPFADAYTAGSDRRAQAWQAMTQALMHAARLQRKAARYALQEPAVGASLLATAQWLERLSSLKGRDAAVAEPEESLRRWAKRRILRLHNQLQLACKETDSPDHLHRVRILAKRMRYGIEALHALLPKHHAQHWYQQATGLQISIGSTRDVVQAGALVVRLKGDRGLVEFLRGIVAGQESRPFIHADLSASMRPRPL